MAVLWDGEYIYIYMSLWHWKIPYHSHHTMWVPRSEKLAYKQRDGRDGQQKLL